MRSTLKKLLLVGILCITGAVFGAEDYYTALERAEKWLGQHYDKSSLVYRERRRKLETIVSSKDAESAKIAALKKEFPEAFSSNLSASMEVALSENVKLELVLVAAGSFEMSAKDGENFRDEIPHQVTLTRDFYIGKTEVTQAQYRAVMGKNPSFFKGDDLPAEKVSWHDAMKFCAKLNKSGKAPRGWKFTLPTETQWEYAARGGNKSRNYKYSGSNTADDVAWYYENSGDRRVEDSSWSFKKLKENSCKTHPVGGKRANELGLYDMSGNVWEWCQDNYVGNSNMTVPEMPHEQGGKIFPNRVIRGGSWHYGSKCCRTAARGSNNFGYRGSMIGFRVALVKGE